MRRRHRAMGADRFGRGSGPSADRPPGTDRPPSTGRTTPPRAAAEQGHARLDVVRRRGRRTVRARLGRSFVVRNDIRDVLDAQPEGVRRPPQARSGVPGPRSPQARRRGSRGSRGRAAGSGATRRRHGAGSEPVSCRRGCGPRRGRVGAGPGDQPTDAATDPHHLLVVGGDGRSSRDGSKRSITTRGATAERPASGAGTSGPTPSRPRGQRRRHRRGDPHLAR